MRLVSGRRLYDDGAMVRRCPSLADLAPGAVLRANPDDLRPLGITSGGRVRVTSARGSVEVAVEADRGVPRGSVSLAFNQPGPGAADLIDSGQPLTKVRLETVASTGGGKEG
jgi:anaerobic selenocysteine-containing dehydrogenase